MATRSQNLLDMMRAQVPTLQQITPAPVAALAPAATPAPSSDLYSAVLTALGVPADQIGKPGWWNGIPTSGTTPRPASVTVANTWGNRTAAMGLPGWAKMILGTSPQLSPDNQKKLYNHWVLKQNIQPQWADIAAARPDWATDQMKAMLGAPPA